MNTITDTDRERGILARTERLEEQRADAHEAHDFVRVESLSREINCALDALIEVRARRAGFRR